GRLCWGTMLALGQESGEEELELAASALVELGDREHAARAEILLADSDWRAGQRDAADAHLERAVDLVTDIPNSSAKARVLSEVSRYHMLGDRFDDAIRIGRQALEMASELRLDEVRAHALNNIGSARANSGHLDGLGDLEQSIKISDEIGSPESLRGYNNLFASNVSLGLLEQAAAAVRAGLPVAERFGNAGASARWLRFERVHIAYWEGRWEEAMAIIDETFSEVGSAHALSRFAFEMRGRMSLARDDTQGASEDADVSLALARQAKDPQTLFPALSFAAVAALEEGRAHDAERFAEELLALKPAD